MPLPIRTMRLHPNTMGNAPTRWFGHNQRWGQAIGWVPPKQIKSIFLHTTINCCYGWLHRLWQCQSQSAQWSFIPTPRATPQRVGLVGINGGGEQLGGFHRSKLNQFFYIFYTQQSTAAMADCIACGNATPNPHDEASSQNHGRRPYAWIWLESMVGASNWVGSAVGKINRFFYTQQSTGAMADCIDCGNATPNPHNEASSLNHGRCPNASVWS